MDLHREEKDGKIFLKIEGGMSIFNAADLRKELAACFKKKYKGLALDLGEVSECDTTGIQLVCSARVSAETLRKSFVVSKASSVVDDAFLRAGINVEDFQNPEKEMSDG